MIESAAAQWKPRNGPEAAADFFSSRPNKTLDPHKSNRPKARTGPGQQKNDGRQKAKQ